MNDIETLVRESLRYDGGLKPLFAEPLVRRARRRRLIQRVGTGAVVGALSIAALAAWAPGTQVQTQVDVVEPATSGSPTTPVKRAGTPLNSTDRVTTPEGAVIVVTPEKLCVGNTHEEPSCLLGVDPMLQNPSSGMGWYTTSPKDFVFAWLVPGASAQASLQVGNSTPLEADLFRVEGRQMLIAVVTGTTCWSDGVTATQVATDATGASVYSHMSAGGSCR